MNEEKEKKLLASLALAQKELENPTANQINPHYKSSYADLSEVLEKIREVFPKHGLSFCQLIQSEGDDYFLKTLLLHESGEQLESKFKLLIDKKSMQELGKAITYARRYSLASMAGLAQKDDDGEPSRLEREVVTVPDNSVKNNFNSRHSLNLIEYTYPFGKLKGKKFKDIGRVDLTNAHRWLCDTDKDKFQDLISKIESYLKQIEQIENQDLPPIPEFDPNEQIPF